METSDLHRRLGYQPRPDFIAFHQRTARFACIVAHRRAGKTVAAVADLIDCADACERPNPRFAYVAPLLTQAKAVAWTYLKEFAWRLGDAEVRESELRIDLARNGAQVRLYGADNPDKLRGLYLDGVVLDEFADMPAGAWTQVIRPALADRAGDAVFIGTPKGKNEFWRIRQRSLTEEDWFPLELKASTTGILPEKELEVLRRELSEEEYAREFECSFEAAVRGAYYGKLLTLAETEGRIGRAPADPAAPVHAAFDLGIGDATAIWLAQFIGREIRLVDYVENSGVGLDWYARTLREKGHLYAPLILPHDAQARELGTGKSRVEMLESMGFATRVLPASGVEDGIEAVRRFLPRTWIDAEKCAAGLEALRLYQARFDDKRGLTLGPQHDWTSHAADALRYLMCAYEEPAAPRKPVDRPVFTGSWMR